MNRRAFSRNSSCRLTVARMRATLRAEVSMQSPNDRFRPNAAPESAEAADDAACLAAVVRGDREAFERLYRRYYERLFRFSLRVTGRIHLVGDVINETMMVVWRRASEYRAAAQVSTWIFGIAYRKSLKALARDGRHNTESLDDVPEIDLQMPETVDREAMHAGDSRGRRVPAAGPSRRRRPDISFQPLVRGNCADPGLPGGHGEIAHVPRSCQIAPAAGPSAGGLMP